MNPRNILAAVLLQAMVSAALADSFGTGDYPFNIDFEGKRGQEPFLAVVGP